MPAAAEKSDVEKAKQIMELARPTVQPPIVIKEAEEVKLVPTTVQPVRASEAEVKRPVPVTAEPAAIVLTAERKELFAMYASLIVFDDDIVIPLPTPRCCAQRQLSVRKATKRSFEGDNYDLNDKVNDRPYKKCKVD